MDFFFLCLFYNEWSVAVEQGFRREPWLTGFLATVTWWLLVLSQGNATAPWASLPPPTTENERCPPASVWDCHIYITWICSNMHWDWNWGCTIVYIPILTFAPVLRHVQHLTLLCEDWILLSSFFLSTSWMQSDVAFLFSKSWKGTVQHCRVSGILLQQLLSSVQRHSQMEFWNFSLLLTWAQLCGRRWREVIPMEGEAVTGWKKLPLWIMILSDISSSFLESTAINPCLI